MFAGLTSSWNYPIYCSEITGTLLVQRHGVREDLIHTLQVLLKYKNYLPQCGSKTALAGDSQIVDSPVGDNQIIISNRQLDINLELINNHLPLSYFVARIVGVIITFLYDL